MPAVIYGDGTLYGAADAYYGRIDQELLAAQDASVRETGLRVTIVDERLNRWSQFVAQDNHQRPATYFEQGIGDITGAAPYDQTSYHYRAQSDMCELGNGNIIRVRTDVDTRNVMIQTITDPTVVAQWEAWSTLYTGEHFGLAIAPDTASTYVVYSSKADGLYRNNIKVWNQVNIVGIKMHKNISGENQKDVLWASVVSQGYRTTDPISGLSGRRKQIDIYFTTNANGGVFNQAEWNFGWRSNSVSSITLPDGKWARITAYPYYFLPGHQAGVSLLSDIITTDLADLYKVVGGSRLIRGMPAAGHRANISAGEIFLLADGYYYLMYKEIHRQEQDAENEGMENISSVRQPLVWQRSKDCENWNEPVHMGTYDFGISSVIETDSHVYLSGRTGVIRRPNSSIEYDISNYVPRASWESPRDNQAGSGEVVVANPDDVNDHLLSLADRRIIIEPGIKTSPTGQFKFKSLEDLWIQKITKQTEGEASRLQIRLGTVWAKLGSPFRDIFNFIGKTNFKDWAEDRLNQSFNYYFVSGQPAEEPTEENHLRVEDGGIALWTAWKGWNPEFHVSFDTKPFAIYFRYIDPENHLKVIITNSGYKFIETTRGVDNELVSDGTSVGSRFGIRARWNIIQFYIDGILDRTYTHTGRWHLIDGDTVKNVHPYPGYVGFSAASTYEIWNFDFSDLEYDYRSRDLIKQVLAMADYHDVKVGRGNIRQYALIWGPQSDITTPAAALSRLLNEEKLELVWRDSRIEVGRFRETDIRKIIDNRIIRTDYQDSGVRRLNLAQVDGNEYTWFEIDLKDALRRGQMINSYLDLPELLEPDDVMERAIEEIRRSTMGDSPGGITPLFFDIWRMDPVTWIDNRGISKDVRIEGIQVEIEQGQNPSQRQIFDTSLLVTDE